MELFSCLYFSCSNGRARRSLARSFIPALDRRNGIEEYATARVFQVASPSCIPSSPANRHRITISITTKEARKGLREGKDGCELMDMLCDLFDRGRML